MNNQMIFLFILFLPISVVLAFIPYLTRKTENFGVSIPESMYEREDFKAMRKKYAMTILAGGFLTIVILFIIGLQVSPTAASIIFTIMTIVFLIGSFLLYLPFHVKMKKMKIAENWNANRTQSLVVNMKFRQEKLTYSNWWFVIPALITLATITVTFILYDDIPKQIPIHTSFTGKVTYDDKSFGNVLLLPFSQLFMVVIFLVVNYVIKHSKQQVSVENPEKSKLQNILFRRRWSLYVILSAILMTFMFAFLQMTFIYPALMPYEDPIIFSTIGAVLIGTIILSITTGQGGSRIKLNNRIDDSIVDRDDDEHWKLGQFYFNKNDPAIFVEKRFGIGWTNNWAHPISWILLIVIIGLAIGIPILLTLF